MLIATIFKRKIPGRTFLVGASLALFLSAGWASSLDVCFAAAAARYRVSEHLLRAIARVESGFNAQAVGVGNVNGSTDHGLMQINSRWLRVLRRYGIDRAALMEPCVNIHVGAWILAGEVARHGPTWRAVGAYNAVSPIKQASYVRRVMDNLEVGR